MNEINKEERMQGLSGQQVSESKAKYGTNELAKKETESLWSMFIGAFDDIWIKVLCAALALKVILAVLGIFVPALSGGNDVVEIISIVIAIALATGFSTLSEYRNTSRSEALQEEYSKTYAKVVRDGKLVNILTSEIVKGDTILIQAGDKVPADGLLFEGKIKVSQAALNGESRDENKAAVTNMDEAESTDYSSHGKVFMGSVVTSGEGYMIATVIGDSSELGKINKALTDTSEEEERKDTSSLKLEGVAAGIGKLGVSAAAIAGILHVVLTLIRADQAITVVSVLLVIAEAVMLMASIVIMAVPEGLPMMNSLVQSMNTESMYKKNILVSHKAAFSDSAYMNVLFSDKTGTITFGNRLAADFYPVAGVEKEDLIYYSVLSSLLDGTPEGKSTVELGEKMGCRVDRKLLGEMEFVEFTAQTKMSGADLKDGTIIRKGAGEAIKTFVKEAGGTIPQDLEKIVTEVSNLGGTPLVVCADKKIYGVIYLKDTVKPGLVERFARLREIGIKTIMCTGDNPLTAATIAKEAGVDGFIAECKPEDKIEAIKKEQAEGKLIAMTGDGTNDAPALAQADVGLAMNSGTQAAKEAANMVDLDSDPTKVLGSRRDRKTALITRGSLTTLVSPMTLQIFCDHSGNVHDRAPADADPEHHASGNAGKRDPLSIDLQCDHHSESDPDRDERVKYKPMKAEKLLLRNMGIYGVGGIIVPFVGIKLIDLIIAPLLHALGI